MCLSGVHTSGACYKLRCMQVANAIFMMPRDTHDTNPVIQAMLQGLSWCERHREADLASRNAYLTSQGKVHLPRMHLPRPQSHCASMASHSRNCMPGIQASAKQLKTQSVIPWRANRDVCDAPASFCCSITSLPSACKVMSVARGHMLTRQ